MAVVPSTLTGRKQKKSVVAKAQEWNAVNIRAREIRLLLKASVCETKAWGMLSDISQMSKLKDRDGYKAYFICLLLTPMSFAKKMYLINKIANFNNRKDNKKHYYIYEKLNCCIWKNIHIGPSDSMSESLVGCLYPTLQKCIVSTFQWSEIMCWICVKINMSQLATGIPAASGLKEVWRYASHEWEMAFSAMP